MPYVIIADIKYVITLHWVAIEKSPSELCPPIREKKVSKIWSITNDSKQYTFPHVFGPEDLKLQEASYEIKWTVL